MKPSGVEWLGDVPDHWEVASIGSRFDVQLGQMLNEERANGSNLKPYLRVLDVQWGYISTDNLPLMNFTPAAELRYRLEPGDLLVNEGGSYVGRSAIWNGELEECFYQKALHRVRPNRKGRDTPEFLFYLMRMATELGVFRAEGNQTTIDHLTAEQLRAKRFAFPPYSEQLEIAAFLHSNKEGRLIEEAERAVGLLQERRASLIAAAVAGQIDVRRWTPTDVREAVSATIIFIHARDKTFGRVKNQKLLYLAEVHAGIHEIGGRYTRNAAGPYDWELISQLEQALEEKDIITVNQTGGRGSAVNYAVKPVWKPDPARLKAMLADRLSAFDVVNQKLATLDTHGAEAVATLYAVWNDALVDGEIPDDDLVIRGFLEDWHPEKRKKFKEPELRTWLSWMRRNGLVPTGRGPRTVTGRLFA